MRQAVRSRRVLPVVLSGIACAAAFSACPLAPDGEKDRGKSSMDFTSAQAVCTDGERLYLTDGDEPAQGAVKSVDLSRPFATAVAEGLNHPTCILTDGQHLFWLDEDVSPNGAVRRSGLDGGAPATLAAAVDSPHAIAMNGTYVFFADTRGGVTAISRVPKAGGEVTLLATLASDFRTTLVADESWVYFTAPYDRPGGFIGRVPVAGGPSETVITGLGTPTALSLSGNTLCFTEFMGGKVACVQDVSVSWTPAELASGENVNFGSCPGLLVQDHGTVYYAVSLSAMQDGIRMVIPGFAPVTLASTQSFATMKGLVILGSKIYWLESDSLWSVKKVY